MSNSSERGPAVEGVLSEAKWLRGLARYLVRDPAEAEDMVQETWVATLRASPEPRSSMRPWLAQVLRNVCRRGVRGAARRSSREAGLAQLQEGEVAPSTESMLARLELARVVSETVRSLEEPYRTTLLLRFFEDRQPAEIARAQGIPGGTVRWRLSEGLRRVRARLDEAHGGNRETWRAILLLPLPAPAAAPVPPGAARASTSFSARTVTWMASAALVPALVAGLLLGRSSEPASVARTAPPPEPPNQPEETTRMTSNQNRMTTLFGLVLPALVASGDAAAAPDRSASATAAPPLCVPANNPAGCIELIPRGQLPAPVEAALARAIGGRKVDKLKIEPRLRKGHATYTVKFEVNDLDEEIAFGAEGTFIESEIDVPLADLPPLITRALTAALPGAVVSKAELHNEAAVSFHELDNGVPRGPLRHRPASRFYELETHGPDGKHKVKISEDGKLLQKKLSQ